MSPQEAKDFEAHPLIRPILALRKWDEKAKDPQLKVPALPTYEDMLMKHLCEESDPH